jgi:hypothetical protein
VIIEVNHSKLGLHRWDDAPDKLWWQRTTHAHLFHVSAAARARRNSTDGGCCKPCNARKNYNRVQVELLRDVINQFACYPKDKHAPDYVDFAARSCAQIAEEFATSLIVGGYDVVTVSAHDCIGGARTCAQISEGAAGVCAEVCDRVDDDAALNDCFTYIPYQAVGGQ